MKEEKTTAITIIVGIIAIFVIAIREIGIEIAGLLAIGGCGFSLLVIFIFLTMISQLI